MNIIDNLKNIGFKEYPSNEKMYRYHFNNNIFIMVYIENNNFHCPILVVYDQYENKDNLVNIPLDNCDTIEFDLI